MDQILIIYGNPHLLIQTAAAPRQVAPAAAMEPERHRSRELQGPSEAPEAPEAPGPARKVGR